ncbi:ATP-binding cassette sub-family A member [Acrasis kona]|uniref:ATP-binding cassette sub-family A member n=1 Tax=Acrasis kona TaxID=1008807 RepID=A0AAW2YZ76_9EUKA
MVLYFADLSFNTSGCSPEQGDLMGMLSNKYKHNTCPKFLDPKSDQFHISEDQTTLINFGSFKWCSTPLDIEYKWGNIYHYTLVTFGAQMMTGLCENVNTHDPNCPLQKRFSTVDYEGMFHAEDELTFVYDLTGLDKGEMYLVVNGKPMGLVTCFEKSDSYTPLVYLAYHGDKVKLINESCMPCCDWKVIKKVRLDSWF